MEPSELFKNARATGSRPVSRPFNPFSLGLLLVAMTIVTATGFSMIQSFEDRGTLRTRAHPQAISILAVAATRGSAGAQRSSV